MAPKSKSLARVTANDSAIAQREVVIGDSLANVMTGGGTSVDRKTHNQWQTKVMDRFSVMTAFKSSWLMRRIVKIPTADATRRGRDWQAGDDDIEKLEREEKRLRIREKMKEGLLLGRLGGGVLILGINQGQPSEPVDYARLKIGDLRYVRPISRHKIGLGPNIENPMDDDFGEPAFFTLKQKNGTTLEIHRSRVIVFKGSFEGALDITGGTKEDAFWGVSVVEEVDDAVKNAVLAQDEIAGLIHEAKIDVFRIPELMNKMGDTVKENQIMRRLELAQLGKSVHRALIADKEEEWDQRQITWAGMEAVISIYLACAAGASGIPATRLLGKSPDGMNATGESDAQNYNELIEDIQTDSLRPAYDKLDLAFIPATLGKVDLGIYYEFPPLSTPSETQAAEIESKEITSARTLVDMGLLPEQALARATANRLMESGRWPGLEDALSDIGERWWEAIPDFDEQNEPPVPVVPGAPGVPAPKPAPTVTK